MPKAEEECGQAGGGDKRIFIFQQLLKQPAEHALFHYNVYDVAKQANDKEYQSSLPAAVAVDGVGAYVYFQAGRFILRGQQGYFCEIGRQENQQTKGQAGQKLAQTIAEAKADTFQAEPAEPQRQQQNGNPGQLVQKGLAPKGLVGAQNEVFPNAAEEASSVNRQNKGKGVAFCFDIKQLLKLGLLKKVVVVFRQSPFANVLL